MSVDWETNSMDIDVSQPISFLQEKHKHYLFLENFSDFFSPCSAEYCMEISNKITLTISFI